MDMACEKRRGGKLKKELRIIAVPRTTRFAWVRGKPCIITIIMLLLCWGLVFADSLTLQDALKIAMENNPEIKSVKAEYYSLKYGRQIVEAEYNLNASVTNFFGWRNMQAISESAPAVMPKTIMMLPTQDWNSANFSLMLPLYTGGLVQSSIKSAYFKEAAGEKDVTAIENEVAFQVKEKYYNALFKIEEVKVYSRLVNLEKEALRISENLFNAGKIPLFYHLRAKNELARAQQELNIKQAEREIVLAEFKKVLGKNQDYEVLFCDFLTAVPFDKQLSEAVKAALQQRPDLKSMENKVKSAEEEVKKTKSSYHPQVYLGGMYDYKSNIDHGYSVSAIASLPVFDSGGRRFKVEQANKNLEKILSLKKDLELSIEREIVKAFQELKAARENVILSNAAVAEAEEVYKIAKLKYEEKKGIYIEILDALLNLTDASTRKYEAIYKNNTAAAELYLKMGQR